MTRGNNPEEQDPTEEQLRETDIHNHVCANCDSMFPCTETFCDEPYMCAECFLTEGESDD